ncbi:uncharacterized protein LOC125483309 [Rhincodon typus]|uniref:uncharacterized protein LOC125483309 n=1 Tax=Rhincodon typus TaxID=259920 RepID=UPI00202F60A0|nr:uncharacterized protein LOC125483309 [Rhincodon typus]
MAEGGDGVRVCLRCRKVFQIPELPNTTSEHLPYLLQCEHVFCGTCLKVQHINSDVICLLCQVPTPVDADTGVEALPLDKYIIGALYAEKMFHNTKNNAQMVTEDSEVSNDSEQKNKDNKLPVTERKLYQECKHLKSELDTSDFDKIYWSQKGIPASFSKLTKLNGECERSIMCPELSATRKERQDYLELKMKKTSHNGAERAKIGGEMLNNRRLVHYQERILALMGEHHDCSCGEPETSMSLEPNTQELQHVSMAEEEHISSKDEDTLLPDCIFSDTSLDSDTMCNFEERIEAGSTQTTYHALCVLLILRVMLDAKKKPY